MRSDERQHLIMTTNGVEGACSAAMILRAHPPARIQFTSPRHIATALSLAAEAGFGGQVNICGVGISTMPIEDVLQALTRLGIHAQIVWYAGQSHPELTANKKALANHCTLVFSNAPTDTEVITRHFGFQKTARGLLMLELAGEAMLGNKPRSELHRYCHDLVAAANRRFYFFGDDTLNEKAIRYLAELESKTHELDEVVEEYRRSEDALYPLGSSEAMRELRRHIGRVGPVPEPVLIFGPTGSGKEVMAKALHVTSGRKGVFVPVNCAVLGGNPSLVEDRLFGHVAGAYTGAATEAKGAFEEANGGTLFLDEIGELPPEVQSQLLRVLEERVIRPMGTMKTRRVDVRIVAATHRDLGHMVGQGSFREDLFYRLNVLVIRVPSLRERPDDMRSIAAHAAQELKKNGYDLSLGKGDWDALRGFEWPGNVRQFLNVLKRAAYLGRPIAEVLDEERASRQHPETTGVSESLSLYCPETPENVSPAEEVYRAYLKHVLNLFEGNVLRTARALRIAPNTLRKHM